MRILYLAPKVPFPPDKGERIRTYHMIRGLVRRHEIWCACFSRSEDDAAAIGALQQEGITVITVGLNRWMSRLRAGLALGIDESAYVGYHHSDAMVRTVQQLSSDVGFSAVVAFSSAMAPYADHVDAPRRILDMCDRDSVKWALLSCETSPPRSWILAAEATRLARYEDTIARRFDETVLISHAECADWRAPRFGRVHVVGNGVETSAPLPPPSSGNVIGFVGDMSYLPNEKGVIWFADHVWPAVYKQCPDARFRIVGRSPSRRVRSLEYRPGIEVTGQVSSVREQLAQMRVVIAPLHIARGVQNKVLEAMACPRPVVATNAAAQGLLVEDGKQLLIADDADRFGDNILTLLTDPIVAERLSTAARDHVERHFRWSDRVAEFEQLVVGQNSLGLARNARRFARQRAALLAAG